MTTDPSEHVDAGELADAANPDVGTGTPETAPWETVEIPWLRREPIVAFALLLVLAQLGAALTALAASSSPTLAVVLLAAAGVVTIAAGVVRRHVTPTALPKLDSETPLGVVNPR